MGARAVNSEIDAAIKDTDILDTAIYKASLSCCASFNNLSAEDNKFAFDEAGKLVTEVEAIASALATLYQGGAARAYDSTFAIFVMGLDKKATKLEGCLAERSPKEEMVKTTDYTSKLKIALDKTTELYPYYEEEPESAEGFE